MPISPYIRSLRARVGPARLLLPSVSAHVFDDSRKLLLVRQRESGAWSTPGGSIEPDERPADAVVRETWEETGLLVVPQRLQAILGGPEFVVRYPNGDEVQYVIAGFECSIAGGAVSRETEETVDARYFSHAEASALELSAWLRSCLASIYSRSEPFHAPGWRPAS